jgi:hypothetical protein
VAGFLVAIDSAPTRSEGGNALRATRAWGILEAVETVGQITLTPTAYRMALTAHLGGDLEMRWSVWRGGPEHQPTAKGESLGRGMGSHKRLQTGVFLRSQGYRACTRHGHGQDPYRAEGAAPHEANMPMILPVVAPKKSWHRIYEMDI